MRTLITGSAGSGKSAVCAELTQRGHTAFDADYVPGLGGWVDLQTNQKTTVDVSGVIDFSKIAFNWDEHVLDDLARENPRYFLCGRASNQVALRKCFDNVLILVVDPDTHDERLRMRDKPYGKHPDMRREIISDQPLLLKGVKEIGAVAVNASQPLARVVDEILWHSGFQK